MTKRSAGLVLYRRPDTTRLEVLLVHPGGPLWTKRDDAWWSIPKGEVDPGEDPLACAVREAREELGAALTDAPDDLSRRAVALGEVVQAGGKHVAAWAVETDLDPSAVVSGTFEMEWPPRSGRRRSFPEVDRAAWYGLDQARRKILGGQAPFLDRLADLCARG